MKLRKLICWLKGHDYHVIEARHHDPKNREFIFQCTRCGRKVKYKDDVEMYADMIAGGRPKG